MSLLILCQSPVDSRFLRFANVKEGLVLRMLGRETESCLRVDKEVLLPCKMI